MAEATQYFFSHQEVATALVKAQGLHEGLWSLSVSFGFGAINIGSDPNAGDLSPSGIVQVQKIGLQRTTEKTSLAVDAAEVNPPSGNP